MQRLSALLLKSVEISNLPSLGTYENTVFQNDLKMTFVESSEPQLQNDVLIFTIIDKEIRKIPTFVEALLTLALMPIYGGGDPQSHTHTYSVS